MAALTKARARRTETWKYKIFQLAAGKKAFKNGIAAYDQSAAVVIPGEVQTDLIPFGLFAEDVDNSAGGASVEVNVELFREVTVTWYANDGVNPVLATDLGKNCYMIDDQTVSILSTGRSVLGRVWAIDATKGVAVEVI